MSAISQPSAGTGATRGKLEVVGFGLLAPMFFVAAGLRFDVGALTGDGLVLVPMLLAAMILTRAVPSLIFLRVLPPWEVIASALLMSTKLTFVVAAVQIGLPRRAPDGDGVRTDHRRDHHSPPVAGVAAWTLRPRPSDSPGPVDDVPEIPGDAPPERADGS